MSHLKTRNLTAFCSLIFLVALAPATVFAQSPQPSGGAGGGGDDYIQFSFPFSFSSNGKGVYLSDFPPGAGIFDATKASTAADCKKQMMDMEIWLYGTMCVETFPPQILFDQGTTHYHRQIEDQNGFETWEFDHTHYLDGVITVEGTPEKIDAIIEIWLEVNDWDYELLMLFN